MKVHLSAKQVLDARRMLEYHGKPHAHRSDFDAYFDAQDIAEAEKVSMAALYAEKSREA